MLAVQFERGVGNLSGPLTEHIRPPPQQSATCIVSSSETWTGHLVLKYLFLFSQLICALF